MRWLLLKDLRVLRRSPLLTGLLVIYPIAIAVLIGLALSRGPEKPRVAFLSEVPERADFKIGQQRFDILAARRELYQRLDIVEVKDRAEARRRVLDGDVLGALILPADLVDKLESGGLARPKVEVLVNEDDPVKARLVDDQISALLSDANRRLSDQLARVTLGYLDLLVSGGQFSFLGQSLDVLGLEKSERIVTDVRAGLPRGSPLRPALTEVIEFSRLARQNLDLSDELLAALSQPIEVEKRTVAGEAPPLSTFAISVSAAITLMFVTVLLVAGALALEREENTFTRLTRGPLGQTRLLAAKMALGVLCSLAVTALLLGVLALFVPLDWGRAPLWPIAIVFGAAAFAAMGAAIGAAAGDVRAGSLLAFMVSLPIAFVSLVPSGALSPALFDALEAIGALFPFAPTLDAMSGVLHKSGPDLPGPLLHLAALTLVYGALARVALRRLA